MLAVLRVNLHLERMADYCVTVAKLTKLMGDLNVTRRARSASSIEDMGQRAEQMIRVALDAFADARRRRRRETLVELDELIDRANRNATEDVLSLGDSPEEREYGLRMLVVSRCVERIGDHAVDIGEQVAYLVTGEFREFSDASHPRRARSALRVLDEDVADAVRGRLARVDRVLERLVDVLPADHDHRVDPVVLEEARARGARDLVASVLDLLDRDHALPSRGGPSGRRAAPRARSVACTSSPQSSSDCRVGALDAVEAEQLGGVLDRVGDVVDRERERDDVLAVVRRDEHAVRQREQLRDDAVGLVLELLHLVLRTAADGQPTEALLDRRG